MAVPALRQPRLSNQVQERPKLSQQNVIITLKDDKKLVVTSDSYHGIIMKREMFKCVFCGTDMQLDVKYKEFHKMSESHKHYMRSYPHADEFADNLIRKINKNINYCTICNEVVTAPFLYQHVSSESHCQELDQAVSRAATYKPI